MIDQPQLEFWLEKLKAGDRIHRKESLEILEELIELRAARERDEKAIEVIKHQHAVELNALRIQLQQVNSTISLLAGRGNRTEGTLEQGRPTEHGVTHTWPEPWGDPKGRTCDWGDCDEPATAARFDAHGHGWLPVCEDCATKPL